MSTQENKPTKKASSYAKSSSDGKIVGLLVGILAVGICLLGVSVAGMVNISRAPVAETTTLAPLQDNNQNQGAQNDVPVINNQTENTTAAQNTETPGTPDNNSSESSNTSAPQTDAEWLAFFNTSLNKLKTDGPSLTKEKQVKTTDVQLSNPLGQTYVSLVKDKFLSEDIVSTPIGKGDTAAAIANISPDGKNYVSTLTMNDIKSLSHTTDANGNYVITINALDLTNPDVSGPYGKVFIFLTVDEVMESYAPDIGATVARENVEIVFKNCSATATISPDGKVLAYETTLNINMILKDAKVKVITTDVDASLYSHTEYKNIVW